MKADLNLACAYAIERKRESEREKEIKRWKRERWTTQTYRHESGRRVVDSFGNFISIPSPVPSEFT